MLGKRRREKRTQINAYPPKYACNIRLVHSGLSSVEEGMIKKYITKGSAIPQSGGILHLSVVVKISGGIGIIGEGVMVDFVEFGPGL